MLAHPLPEKLSEPSKRPCHEEHQRHFVVLVCSSKHQAHAIQAVAITEHQAAVEVGHRPSLRKLLFNPCILIIKLLFFLLKALGSLEGLVNMVKSALSQAHVLGIRLSSSFCFR